MTTNKDESLLKAIEQELVEWEGSEFRTFIKRAFDDMLNKYAALSPAAQPQEMELPPLPRLPDRLLKLIGEYGMARTDGVNQLEVQHRWLLLIDGIKDYTSAYALQAISAIPAKTEQKPTSSIDYHQQRGVHADIINEALAAYDQFMLDDDYDSQGALDRIMVRMRERQAFYAAPSQPSKPVEGRSPEWWMNRAKLEEDTVIGAGSPDEFYKCSNPACGAEHAIDPKGHCPTCITPEGTGWSCVPHTRKPAGSTCSPQVGAEQPKVSLDQSTEALRINPEFQRCWQEAIGLSPELAPAWQEIKASMTGVPSPTVSPQPESKEVVANHEALAELLHDIGWRSDCDAQWTRLRDAMPKIAAMFSCDAAEPVKEQPERCTSCDGTGDMHDAAGEWRGKCTACDAASPAPAGQPISDEELIGAWLMEVNLHPSHVDAFVALSRRLLSAAPAREKTQIGDLQNLLDEFEERLVEDTIRLSSSTPSGNSRDPDPEIADIRTRLNEILRSISLFTKSAYPVSLEIDKRGYRWSEAYLDEARTAAIRALSTPQQAQEREE